MISKIESNQYTELAEIDVCQLLDNTLDSLKDFIQHKNICVEKHYQSGILLQANQSLIDLMVGNLLNNAIKHNIQNGLIVLNTTTDFFEIQNTGLPLNKLPEDLFNRFVKNSDRPDSLGLGLAIVKKICDFNQFNISYTIENQLHIIRITFVDSELK